MTILNRKARYEYEIIKEYVAGIVLLGSEVKSIRDGKCNISDSYCYVNNSEIFIKNCHISKYDSDVFTNHDETRERKLLLTKKEIKDLYKDTLAPGLTIIPLKIFINERGLIKITIALCRGKKLYDKRETIKERDLNREINALF